MVAKDAGDSCPKTSRMKMSWWGILRVLAACKVIGNNDGEVTIAFAPDDLSCFSSSEVEEAAFAGVTMPDKRCMAWATVM